MLIQNTSETMQSLLIFMGLCFTVELHLRVEMLDFNEICQNCRLQTCLYTNDEKAIANQDFMEWQPCHSLVMAH